MFFSTFPKGECGPRYFECASGGCVPGYRLCNGNADCEDFTDELKCGKTFKAFNKINVST